MTKSELQLYFDDSGSRNPDHGPPLDRTDGMDCFALGGILVKKEDIDCIYARHRAFCSHWKITYPLHSQQIRGGRGKFGWLKNPATSADFFPELNEFLVDLPVIGVAAVIDRPGYMARYKARYGGQPWLMCKTACSILVERSAKVARDQGRRLRIFFEQSGRDADRAVKSYVRELKKAGMPFDAAQSSAYNGLSASELKDIVLGEPRERTKEVPMLQIADLYLYPMAKGGYDPNYRAYRELKDRRKLIDCLLPEAEIPFRGIKYSCFERLKNKGSSVAEPQISARS